MSGWIFEPAEAIVEVLTEVPPAERLRLRDGATDHSTFAAAFDALPVLRQIECGGTALTAAGAKDKLRIVAWNVERLRYLDAIGDTLAALAPDVVLLSEIDKGMARSGNGHRIAELAGRFGWRYAYGVEFIELDHGNPQERAAHAGETNLSGFHGNGIVTGLPLHRPFMVRLEAEGIWFGWGQGEPRVGGRMAIGGQVELGGRKVTLVSVHLESNSDAEHRAGQVAHLLDVIERYDAEAPILIGGDLNTSTFSLAERRNPEIVAAALAADPFRGVRVAAYEPLFALLESRGFDWQNCNVPDAATQRIEQPDRARGLGKIDWFFSRGLKASAAAVIPAVQADGSPSSDHECLVVEIELAE